MGSVQSLVIASVTLTSVYLAHVHIYSSHKLLKTRVLSSDRLPGLLYLYLRFVAGSVLRRTGCLSPAAPGQVELVYTVLGCRLDPLELRRFCSEAGYGWDYPDSEYRDTPLCVPEFLCGRLLLMVVSDADFRLRPAGLVCVRQTVKTLEPVDELKKGPFRLQVRVLEYRQSEAGPEADICLSATSRTGSLVWESVLTLLSEKKPRPVTRHSPENESPTEEPVPPDVKQLELRVPRSAALQCVWSSSAYSPFRLMSLAARLFGIRWPTTPSLWMLSVCLAEMEKHKGVGVITAPISVSVHFKEPVMPPGRVTIRFWETTKDNDQCAVPSLNFHIQKHGSNRTHMEGLISRA